MSGMERVEANRDGMAGRRLGAWMLGMAVLVLGSQALAPALRADDAGAGPAARAVRLSSVDGQVQLSKDSQTLADAAVANTPLFEGTHVATGDDGRAEIQFEDGSVARLSPNSSVTLTVLRGARTRLMICSAACAPDWMATWANWGQISVGSWEPGPQGRRPRPRWHRRRDDPARRGRVPPRAVRSDRWPGRAWRPPSPPPTPRRPTPRCGWDLGAVIQFHARPLTTGPCDPVVARHLAARGCGRRRRHPRA